ncbi:cyclin-like protein [Apiosordaria backusii]|uniref:RNA polymerase II holoenzyme cyclin-like subunit n=1 Tax=Apiosordaria backusii TaxID=314023 RepID=A0AA40EM02_9PEZI|nr:cyclin-like protein [Apiosordaria backusii]
MAANFWESTQRRYWQFTKGELAAMRQKLEDEDPNLVQMFPLPQLRHINIYLNQQINRLAKRLGVRQQGLATAQVYIKRFYTRVEIRRTNPYLLVATALYLACKMEECPQHIRLIVQEARGLWPEQFHGQDTSKLGECEFFLISEMSSQLIVHQPYRTLTNLQGEFNLTQDEVQAAWQVINDHYMTDLPLLYPPHVIGLTAILLAIVCFNRQNAAGGANATGAGGLVMAANALAHAQAQSQARMAAMGGNSGPGTPTLTPQGSIAGGGSFSSQGGGEGVNPIEKIRAAKLQRFTKWLAESNVDIEGMIDCTQELVSFYECHEGYDDKDVREKIIRFVKARGLDK